MDEEQQIIITGKYCYHCDTFKAFKEFYKCKGYNKYGITSQCKRCINIINLRYRHKHRETVRQQNKRYYQQKKLKEQLNKLLCNMSYDNTIHYIENHDKWSDKHCIEYLKSKQRSIK